MLLTKSFNYKDVKYLTLFIILSIISLYIFPFYGEEGFDFSMIKNKAESVNAYIFWELRLPRTLLAFAVGATLSISGMVFQGLFRNILATPYTLGIASGSSLGVAVYIQLAALGAIEASFGSVTCAFLGALVSVISVYVISKLSKIKNTVSLLLAGIVINFVFSSIMIFLQYIGDPNQVFHLTRWLMGSIATVGYESVIYMACFSLIGLILILLNTKNLDLLSLGDDFAQTRGVNLKVTHALLFFSISIMVAYTVSCCGPISFIGIIIPYICRIIFGPKHFILSLSSFFLGGIFLVICDSFARTIIFPAELPVGILTALLGGPFFLFVLFFDSKKNAF